MTKEQLDVSNLAMNIKAEDQNPQVVFSPGIKYAASEEFTRKYPYVFSSKMIAFKNVLRVVNVS